MRIELKKLASGTIFSFNGRRWKLNGGWWGMPPDREGVPKHIIGKESVECSPEYGGQFQDDMNEWIPTETVVDVQ